MKTKIFFGLLSLLVCAFSFQGCKKYLDAKPNQNLATASTVSDLQGFLDQTYDMNINCAETGEISADSYYLDTTIYNSLPLQDSRDLYLWKPANLSGDWQDEYQMVYFANLVLDNLPNIQQNSSNFNAWNSCKGSALLFRGKAFFEIVQIWSKAYDPATSSQDLGIPLRLTSDFNVPTKRATVEQTYAQIIADLKKSINLLPVNPLNKFRPSKPAAYGLLARTYLSMRKYDLAKLYADSCLQLNSTLLDFNKVDTTQSWSFAKIQYTNPEDLFHSSCLPAYLDLYYGKIDKGLYSLYDNNDLRRSIYFLSDGAGGHSFKGSYDVYSNYNGVATDEVYLIRAECEARTGIMSAAQNDINTLLENRYVTGTYVPVTTTDQQALLNFILTERRKELIFRMLRWGDIKRLNLEGANISVTHGLGTQTYTLPANDPRFAVKIPAQVIQLSGMQQNP
ncbi:MAG: RagB/SusD family nutrient uptake outer membrane protein [Bacteroidetes bacterium]|nr:RagB/SusD family nutrient uptake outer membrane protein [Bacteroidota bacterium]